MSSDIQHLIALEQSFMIEDFCSTATTAMVAYDYILTLPKEIDLFWKQKFKVSTVVFLANRYLALIIWVVTSNIPPDTSYLGCNIWYWSINIIHLMQFLPWAVFSGVRAYGLSKLQLIPGVIVFLLSLVPLIVNLYGDQQESIVANPQIGCNIESHVTPHMNTIYLISSRLSLLIADIGVLIITWSATYGSWKDARLLSSNGSTLTHVVFRDGTAYFMVLAILNLLHLTLTFSHTGIILKTTSLILPFEDSITSIMISHFLIDLQEANIQMNPQHSLGSMSSLNFESVAGSLVASLPAPFTTTPVLPEEEGAWQVGGEIDQIIDTSHQAGDSA